MARKDRHTLLVGKKRLSDYLADGARKGRSGTG